MSWFRAVEARPLIGRQLDTHAQQIHVDKAGARIFRVAENPDESGRTRRLRQ
jgi:hypothetical protein